MAVSMCLFTAHLLLSAAQKPTGTRIIFCVSIACFIRLNLVHSIKCRVNKKEPKPQKSKIKTSKAALTLNFRQSLLSPRRTGCCPCLRTASVRPSALLTQSNLPIIRPFGPQSRQKARHNTPLHDYRESRRLDDHCPHPLAPLFARTALAGGAAIEYESSRPRYEAGRF